MKYLFALITFAIGFLLGLGAMEWLNVLVFGRGMM